LAKVLAKGFDTLAGMFQQAPKDGTGELIHRVRVAEVPVKDDAALWPDLHKKTPRGWRRLATAHLMMPLLKK
jgi:hypothetical protein